MSASLRTPAAMPGISDAGGAKSPGNLAEAIDLARFRSLMWMPDHRGPAPRHAPLVLGATYLPGPGKPSASDLRDAAMGAVDAFERGGSYLLLSPHAEPLEAAKARVLALTLLQAGGAPASPCAGDASDHALS
jgi:hypothetical protein